MTNLPKEIDFAVDQAFYDSLGEDKEVFRQEIFQMFRFVDYLFRLYIIMHYVITKNAALDEQELQTLGMDNLSSKYLFDNYEKEMSIYKFIYAIMLNKIDEVKDALDTKAIDTEQDLQKTSLFRFVSEKWDAHNINCLHIAASLGRKEICRLLIENGFDVSELLILYGIKAYPIPLSINECLLMNALFQWYKSGKKKMTKDELQRLIDTIILASSKGPSIVDSEHLLNSGIRVQWYWTHIKDAIEDAELLKQLIPLNPNAMNEILNIGG